MTVDCTHPRQGNLSFVLTSPAGTTATIEGRSTDSAAARRWTFHPVGFLGETAAGVWKFKARDLQVANVGTLNGLGLVINGYLPDGTAGGGATGSTTGFGGSTGAGATAGTTATSSGTTTSGSTGSSSSDGSGGSSCGAGSGIAIALVAFLLTFRQRLRRS